MDSKGTSFHDPPIRVHGMRVLSVSLCHSDLLESLFDGIHSLHLVGDAELKIFNLFNIVTLTIVIIINELFKIDQTIIIKVSIIKELVTHLPYLYI